MRNLSAIDENKDLVTKEYADGRVVANPTLAGTESDLTGLQVNGTKYKVPSGGGGGGGTPYDSDPAMDGTASPGSSTAYARGDHVHPSDTSRQANITASGVLIGDGSGGVTAKTLDTSSLTNDNDHVPTSGVVQTAIGDLAPANNAGAHNSVYRGKYLGSSVTAEQYAAISAGTFDDLFIGDYWTIPVRLYEQTISVNWRIAAFDYWLHSGDTECTTHHAVIVPDIILYSLKMNDSATTTGGYVGSKMFTNYLEGGKVAAESAFGSSHILSHRESLVNAVTSGIPSGSTWKDSRVELMNEVMVFGTTAYGTHSELGSEIGIDRGQLPLFAHDPSSICNRSSWWLRSIKSATEFCRVSLNGIVYFAAANTSHGVRPVFAIKA